MKEFWDKVIYLALIALLAYTVSQISGCHGTFRGVGEAFKGVGKIVTGAGQDITDAVDAQSN